MNLHKIAVIGGTGKSGTYLLDRLIESPYAVRALARTPDRLAGRPNSVERVIGNARDYDSIFALLEGCDAVISALGQPRGENASIFSQASRHVVRAMQVHGIKRYIVTTGLHVNTPADQKEAKVQFATSWMHETFPDITQDKQVEYEFLTQQDIDWTLVRLPLIIQTEERFGAEASLVNCPGENISAADLADFLVAQLTDERFIRESPFVYNS